MKEQSATPNSGAGRRSKYRHAAPVSDVVAITNASVAHSEEMRQRMVRYAVAMGIRMVCLAAIFVFDGWFKLVPVIGAVVLPWVAVVIANGGADIVHQETVDLLDEPPRYAVTGGAEEADDDGAIPSDLLTGEIVAEEDISNDDPNPGTGPTGPGGDNQDSAGHTVTQEDKHHEHL